MRFSDSLVGSLAIGYFYSTMRFVLLAIQTALLILPVAASADIEQLIAPGIREALAGDQPLVRPLGADGVLSLLPAVPSAASLAAEVRSSRPTVGVEVLRVIRGLPEAQDTRDGWLKLYNALHAVSTMKGITYWSASRQEQRVLFTESFAIASARTISPIPDPVFGQLPAEDMLHTFQQDQSYGRNTYTQRFSLAGDHIIVRIKNSSTISVAFIPVIHPDGMVSLAVIVPVGRDLLFYGVSYIRTSFPLGDRNKRQESLANRLIAMSNWLRSRLG
jgi:hypothetical protein